MSAVVGTPNTTAKVAHHAASHGTSSPVGSAPNTATTRRNPPAATPAPSAPVTTPAAAPCRSVTTAPATRAVPRTSGTIASRNPITRSMSSREPSASAPKGWATNVRPAAIPAGRSTGTHDLRGTSAAAPSPTTAATANTVVVRARTGTTSTAQTPSATDSATGAQ